MTVYDGKMGALRRAQERERVEGIIARAMPAEGCGPAIPIAPARGPSVAVTPNVVMPDEKSKTGYKGDRRVRYSRPTRGGACPQGKP